jgi:hypothetical protein
MDIDIELALARKCKKHFFYRNLIHNYAVSLLLGLGSGGRNEWSCFDGRGNACGWSNDARLIINMACGWLHL